MVTQKVVVAEAFGLHLRPAGVLCELSQTFDSKISLKKGNNTVNAKSVLGLLAARVSQGDEIEIVCEGEDEEQALLAIVQMIEKGFGLPKEV